MRFEIEGCLCISKLSIHVYDCIYLNIVIGILRGWLDRYRVKEKRYVCAGINRQAM